MKIISRMMAELFAIGGWILNFVTFGGGYFLGKRREKQQNKREIILEYYPNLIENLRLSVPDSYIQFMEGMVGQFDRFFEVLIGMDTDGTLKIIESHDKTLYDDLKIILNELIPSMNDLQEKRRESWQTIPKKWMGRLIEAEEYLPELSVTPSVFVAQITNLFDLWRGNIEDGKKKFDEVCDRRFEWSDENTHEIRSHVFRAFREIAEEEWKPIKSEFESDYKRLNELVEKKILPRMEKTIFMLGK